MTDPKVNLSKISQWIAKADLNGDKRIRGEEETSIFTKKVEKSDLNDAQKTALYSMLGIELSAPAMAKSSKFTIKGVESANENGNSTTTYEDNSDGGVAITVINNNNWYINVNVKVDTQEAIEKAIQALINNDNNNLADFKQFILDIIDDPKRKEEHKNLILEIIKGFFNEVQTNPAADLSKIEDYLQTIIGLLQDNGVKLDGLGDKIDNLKKAVNDLFLQAFDQLQMFGLDVKELVKLVQENNAKQDDQNKILGDIYDALNKLSANFSNFTEKQQEQFNTLMAALKAGDVKLDDVLALLNAIKADTTEGNKIGKELLNQVVKNGEVQQEILEAIKTIGVDLKEIGADVKNVLYNMIAQGADIEDIKELLKAMKADLEEGNGISKDILEEIKNLRGDMVWGFNAVLDELKKNGGKLDDIIKQNDQVKNILEAFNQKINVLGDKIDGLDKWLEAIYNKIPAGGTGGCKINFEKLMQKLNEILAAIKDHDVHVTIDPTDINVNVTCTCDHNGNSDPNEGIKRNVRELSAAFGLPLLPDNNEATGINGVKSDDGNRPKVYYDLGGRRVQNPQRGQIYIVDGKKIVY